MLRKTLNFFSATGEVSDTCSVPHGTPPCSQPPHTMEHAKRFPEEPFIIGPFGKVLFLDAVRAAEVCSKCTWKPRGLSITLLALQLIPSRARNGAEKRLRSRSGRHRLNGLSESQTYTW